MILTTTRALAEYFERRLSADIFDAIDAVTSLRERLVATGTDPDTPASVAMDAMTATEPDRAAVTALLDRLPPERSTTT